MAKSKDQREEVDVEGFKKRIDFHRSIHKNLDDGALLALCEDYTPEEDDADTPS